MKDRDNRQDLATAWDFCRIEFQVPYDRFAAMGRIALAHLCDRLTWPKNWSFRHVDYIDSDVGPNHRKWILSFSVSGPPRAADGAYVRAKLNMIPENFSEHTEAENG